MKSDLSYTEFKARLNALTIDEKKVSFITGYSFSGKPFSGKFDQNSFLLNRNTMWRHIRSIEIKGEYAKIDHSYTEVNFNIQVSTFAKILSNIVLVFAIIAFNSILIANAGLVMVMLITLNVFFALIYLISRLMLTLSMKLVRERFKDEFEIDLKPTDRYGYGKEE